MDRARRQKIRALVNELRARVGAERTRAFNLHRSIDIICTKGIPDLTISTVMDEEMPTAKMASKVVRSNLRDRESKSITITMSAMEALKYEVQWARFAFCHELGHIELNHEGVRYRQLGVRFNAKVDTQIAAEEKEANYFAGNFLVPSGLLQGLTDSNEVSQSFRVSKQLAEIRLEEFGREIRESEGVMRPLPQNVIDFLKESKARGIPTKSLPDEH